MNIMLACLAGMSTSLVVSKMRQAAEEQGKGDYKIWAVDTGQIPSEMGNFDVLLLGPQVRHLLKKVEGMVNGAVPVAIIDPVAYGRCDGAAVLRQAEGLVAANG